VAPAPPLPAAPVLLAPPAPAAPVLLVPPPPAAPVLLAPPAPAAPVSPVGGPVGCAGAEVAQTNFPAALAHQGLRTMQVAPVPQAVPMFVVEQVTLLVVTTVGQASHLYSVVVVVGGVTGEQETA
jgi:hypothetical protein